MSETSNTYRNLGEAIADPASNASKVHARALAMMASNDQRIAKLLAQGMTREQAWSRLLQREEGT